MSNRKSSPSVYRAVCEVLEARRLLYTISGTPAANTINVDFVYENGQAGVEWEVVGVATGSYPFGGNDTIIIEGDAGNDTINVTFEDDYFQEDVAIHVNGGRGNDTISIDGGPGYNPVTNESNELNVNGYDNLRSIWDEVGDRDDTNSSNYDEDTLYVNNPWGIIKFDDGDARLEPDIAPDVYTGEGPDQVFVNDSGFTRWGDVVWRIGAANFEELNANKLMRYEEGAAFPSTTYSAQVDGGRTFDEMFLTTGDGNDTILCEQMDGVTINGGDGDDTFEVAPGGTLGTNSRVIGQINGNNGDDSFFIGGKVGGSRSLHGISGGDPDPFFTGGDGNDTVTFDDRDGLGWGMQGNNQDKSYVMNAGDLELRNNFNSNLTSIIRGEAVETQVLWMQDANPPSGSLSSDLLVQQTEFDLEVHPGTVDETLVIETTTDLVGSYTATLHPSGGTDNVTIGKASTTPTATVSFVGASPTIGTLMIHGNGTAELNLNEDTALKMSLLSIASGGKLDMKAAAAIIDYSGSTDTFDTIMQWLQNGAMIHDTVEGNDWNGDGITSSIVRAKWTLEAEPYAIGALLNNDRVSFGSGDELFHTAFMGQSVDATSILLTYTYMGDADLDGEVGTVDYSLFQAGYGNSVPYNSWSFGDFDFDEDVDSQDFSYFQSGYLFDGDDLF